MTITLPSFSLWAWLLYALLCLLVVQQPGLLLAQVQDISKLQQDLKAAKTEDERSAALARLGAAVASENPEGAKAMIEEACQLARKTENKALLARAGCALATVDVIQGNLVQALDHALESRHIATSNRLVLEEAIALGTLGAIYRQLQENDSSLVLSQRCMALYASLGDSLGMAKSCNNIGVVYANLSQPDSAIKYYRFSNDLLVQLTGKEQPQLQNNIGEILMQQKQYVQAFDYFRRSLAGKKLQGNRSQQPQTLQNMGTCFEGLGQKDSALICFRAALVLAREFHQAREQAVLLSSIARLTAQAGDFRQAYEMEVRARHITDSLDNLGQAEAMARAEVKHHLAFKDRENTLLRTQLGHEHALQRNQQYLLGLSALLVLLLLVLVYVFWKLSRERRQHIERIAALNGSLEQRVAARTEALLRRNAQLASYAELNSHGLRSKLATLLGLMELLQQGHVEDRKGHPLLSHALEAARQIDLIVHEINETTQILAPEDDQPA